MNPTELTKKDIDDIMEQLMVEVFYDDSKKINERKKDKIYKMKVEYWKK